MVPLLRLVELTFGQIIPLLRIMEERLRLVELTFGQIIPLLRLVEVSGGFKKVSGRVLKKKIRINTIIMNELISIKERQTIIINSNKSAHVRD